MPNTYTPVPYREGRQLQLQICKSQCPHLPPSQRVAATIRKRLSMTMSPVLGVAIQTPKGPTIQAVLKLYDRRFGNDLREVQGRAAPHTAENEAAFQTFIRRGLMAPFLRELEAEKKTELVPSRPGDFFGLSAEGRAKYEAALWQECNEHFQCETGAYTRLRDLQGESIPRLIAYISLVQGPDSHVPPDLRQAVPKYFEIKGVLVELIDGYNLEDIATSALGPPDPKKWQRIIQSAADAAHNINSSGVIMEDCSPRNVVVDRRSQMPYVIDFAQCFFKDELIKRWHELGWDEDEDWDPEVEYWERVSGRENPAAIGLVVGARVKEKGLKVDIRYPDYNKIISDIERKKAARGNGRAGAAKKKGSGSSDGHKYT